MTPWTRWIRNITSIRPGEGAPAAYAFLYILVVIAAYVLLKSAREALYIAQYGAVKLPYVMIGIALLVGLFVDLYIRLSRRYDASVLLAATLALFVSNLVLFWALARMGASWLYPVVYIWTGCFGIIAPVQFWTLANEIFSTREAKRLFGFVGAGGILGGILGGHTAALLAKPLGTINLLLVAAGMLALCAVLGAGLLRQRRRNGEDEATEPLASPGSLRHSVCLIAESRHLRVLAGLVFVGALATTIVDYQFKAAAGSHFSAAAAELPEAARTTFMKDSLATFFGGAYGLFNLASFLVQILLVRAVFRRLGIGVAIVVLPAVLALGTGVFIAAGTLWAATLLKAGDGALKHSMDRSSKELAYLPVPRALKAQTKSAIDMVMDRLGDGIGGVLLLVLATTFGVGLVPIAALNALFILAWLVLALRVRRSYIEELGRSIGRPDVRDRARYGSLRDADARTALVRALRSEERGEVLAALDLAELAPGDDLKDDLRRLGQAHDADVRAKAVGLLMDPGTEGLPEGVAKELGREDQELLVKALDVVLAESADERLARAKALMGEGSPASRGTLLALLVRRLGSEFQPVATTIVETLASERSPAVVREAVAFALGLLTSTSPLTTCLGPLLEDPEPKVRARAAESAGTLRLGGLAPRITPLLAQGTTRGAARRALAALDQEAVPTLLAALASPETEASVRRRLPRLLADIDGEPARDALSVGLGADDPELREACLEALVRLRRRHPDARVVGEARVRDRLVVEIAHAERVRRLVGAVRLVKGRDGAFLVNALQESLDAARERILDLLELSLPPRRFASLRRNLAAASRIQRDNALELLESLLPRDLSRRLLPLLEASDAPAGDAPRDTGEADAVAGALEELARDADPWIAACALNVAGRIEWPNSRRAAVNSLGTSGQLLRDEASRVLGRTKPENEEGEGRATLVDRVIALRSIEAFRAVKTHQLMHVARVARERRFEPGEALFQEGDPPGSLYFLLEGRVGLRRGAQPAGEISSGSALGAWSLFDDQPRTLGAVALRAAEVLVVDREDFYDVLTEQPDLMRSLMADMTRRLQRPVV